MSKLITWTRSKQSVSLGFSAKAKQKAAELAAEHRAIQEAAFALLQGNLVDPQNTRSEASRDEQVPLLRYVHGPAGLLFPRG